MTGSKTRWTPPIASQVPGSSRAAHTLSIGAAAMAEWVNVSRGTAAT
jgi:hypothetical protein